MTTTAFHDVLFPIDISWGSSGGPMFKTNIFMADSGYEQRNVNWSVTRSVFDVSDGVKTLDQMDDLNQFFINRKGRLYGFRFRDWGDYQCFAQSIGVGNGTQTVFQTIKTYTSTQAQSGESYSYTRTLTKPEWASFANVTYGVLKLPTLIENTDFTVDYNTGLVTFTVAPPAQDDYGAHAYWRIRFIDSEPYHLVQMASLEFHATVGGADQCTGGTAFGDQPDINDGSNPANAFDGDASTYWQGNSVGANGNVNSVVGYHFAAPVRVKEVLLKSATTIAQWMPTDFAIEYSDDGAAWSIAIDPGPANIAPWTTTGQVQTFPTAPPTIYADFNFHVPVRFDTDKFDASIDTFATASWPNVPVTEIRDWGTQSYPNS